MSNLPIVFTDAYGTHLEVDRPGGAPARGGDVLLRTTGSGHFVLAADVDLMAAISEAGGKPAPIVLERGGSQFDNLVIGSFHAQDGPAAAWVKTAGTACVTSAALPGVTAALWAAAGRPAPIILERPELVATCSLLPGFRIAPDDGKLHVHGEARMAPQQARTLAAYIVARADVLEAAEPDPAEVTALADVIRETSTSMHSGDIARAILRAGYRPPERPS